MFRLLPTTVMLSCTRSSICSSHQVTNYLLPPNHWQHL